MIDHMTLMNQANNVNSNYVCRKINFSKYQMSEILSRHNIGLAKHPDKPLAFTKTVEYNPSACNLASNPSLSPSIHGRLEPYS